MRSRAPAIAHRFLPHCTRRQIGLENEQQRQEVGSGPGVTMSKSLSCPVLQLTHLSNGVNNLGTGDGWKGERWCRECAQALAVNLREQSSVCSSGAVA